MAHPHTSHQRRNGYDGPEHFRLERHNPGLIALWAIGLIVTLSTIGLLVPRLHA